MRDSINYSTFTELLYKNCPDLEQGSSPTTPLPKTSNETETTSDCGSSSPCRRCNGCRGDE
jgi:hypothetical protein